MSDNSSTLLEMNKLNNTRDLGGMKTKDGRSIRPGKLIRSGQLFFADEEDIARLALLHPEKIVDFRSAKERKEKPDPVIGDAENLHLPIVQDVTAGISRDQESDAMAFDLVIQKVKENPQFGIQYMENTYLQMVSDDFAVSQYRRFLDEVAGLSDGALLWHCTAGKDRAGFAAVLLQEILGVSREDILADYLATNVYLQDEIEMILKMLEQKMDIKGAQDVIRDFFGAREQYLSILYDYIEKEYGSMDTFLKDALGVDEEKKALMKRKFLW